MKRKSYRACSVHWENDMYLKAKAERSLACLSWLGMRMPLLPQLL